jgi:hypothetical protein
MEVLVWFAVCLQVTGVCLPCLLSACHSILLPFSKLYSLLEAGGVATMGIWRLVQAGLTTCSILFFCGAQEFHVTVTFVYTMMEVTLFACVEA